MATRITLLLLLLPALGFSQIRIHLDRNFNVDRDASSPIRFRDQDLFLAQLLVRSSQFNPNGGPSEIAINQSGVGNRLNFQDSGVSTSANLGQNGANNELDLTVYGDDNAYSLQQNNNNNYLKITDFRSNTAFGLTQNGNSTLEATFLPGGRGVPMRIEQFGGMQLIVTHGY